MGHESTGQTDRIIGVEGMVQINLVTDLGPGNVGKVFPDARIPKPALEKATQDLAKKELRKPPTKRWRCVDGRVPEGGMVAPEGFADPQVPGGLAIYETGVDLTTEDFTDDDRLSVRVAVNTQQSIANEQEVVVHGDNHTEHVEPDADGNKPETNKAGCIANAKLREIQRNNARNIDVVAPATVTLAERLDLGRHFETPDIDAETALEDEVVEQINRGKRNADRESFWDVGPEEVVDIIVNKGGQYEELIEDHGEIVGSVEITEDVLDEAAYMQENTITLEDGTQITMEAFVASLGIYKKYVFERADNEGRTDLWAARRVIGGILQAIGTVKQATKEGFQVAVLTPK